jgi:pumilio RNA-binding family
METCLQQCPDDQRRALIEALIHSSDSLAPTVAGIARDQYGNYVLQRALEMADEEERSKLILELQPHLESLRRSGYGKHIASRVGKMLVAIARQNQYQEEQKCVAPAVGGEEDAAKEEEESIAAADGNEAAAAVEDNEEE